MGEASVILVDEYVILVDKKVKEMEFGLIITGWEFSLIITGLVRLIEKSDKKRLWLYENRFNFIYS